MQSERYLEHDSTLKNESLAKSELNIKNIMEEKVSGDILNSMRTLMKKTTDLQNLHQQISSHEDAMERNKVRLMILCVDYTSIPEILVHFKFGRESMENTLSNFGENRLKVIKKHRQLISNLNNIFICPIDTMLRENIGKAAETISELHIFIDDISETANDIYHVQLGYIQGQCNVIREASL